MLHVAATARFVGCKCLALSLAFVVHRVGVVLCVLVDNSIVWLLFGCFLWSVRAFALICVLALMLARVSHVAAAARFVVRASKCLARSFAFVVCLLRWRGVVCAC